MCLGEGVFRGCSYCELQSFIEQAIALAVEEGVGAPRLGDPYPGQTGFLQRAMRKKKQNKKKTNHLLVTVNWSSSTPTRLIFQSRSYK